MNLKLVLASITLVFSVVLPRVGVTQNGIIAFEFPFQTTVFIECLDEHVEIELLAIVRTHLVELQNGRVHYVENWFMEGAAVGVESGHTWFAHGPSPFVLNAGAAQASSTLLGNLVYEPLDGGRKFREKLNVQLVVDANGSVRLDRGSQQFRCVGR